MLNKAILQGRLTDDPVIRKTTSGKKVATFTVAVEERFGGKKDTQFLNCTAWAGTADVVESYFKKGNSILLEGRNTIERWKDGNETKSKHTIVVGQIHFLSCSDTKKADANDAPPPEESSDIEPF